MWHSHRAAEFLETDIWFLVFYSVLGTLAAAYMTVAIIIKYHTTSSVVVHISPFYSSGYV